MMFERLLHLIQSTIIKLALPLERHLLRCGCHISKLNVGVINFIMNVDTSTNDAYSYLTEEVREIEIVALLKKIVIIM